MIFQPELAELVVTGRKTQTRRRMSDNPRSPWFRERCGFQTGKDYAVQKKRGGFEIGRILIEEVRAEPLGHIEEKDAKAEGFKSVAEFQDAWEQINGWIGWDEIVWVLTFKPLPAPVSSGSPQQPRSQE